MSFHDSQRVAAPLFAIALSLFSSIFTRARAQSDRPLLAKREALHHVVSQSSLSRPLRIPVVELRYSPDGKYLLLQDLSGVLVLSRSPLKLMLHIRGEGLYESRFSPDSQGVITVTPSLIYNKWSVADGRKLESLVLDIPGGCVDATLSPDGSLFACFRDKLSFGLFDFAARQWTFAEDRVFVAAIFPRISYGRDSAYPGPLGYLFPIGLRPSGPVLARIPIHFSPDGKLLIAGNEAGSLQLDVLAKKKSGLPRGLQKNLLDSLDFIDSKSILAANKSGEAAVLSYPSGDTLRRFSQPADRVRATTNSRYGVLYRDSSALASLLDLEQGQPVALPPFVDADAHDNEIATVTDDGTLAIFLVGRKDPIETVSVPLQPLSALRSVSLNSQWTRLLLSLPNRAAAFALDSGERLADLPSFSAAFPLDESNCLILQRGPFDYAQIEKVNNPDSGVSDRPVTRSVFFSPSQRVPPVVQRLETSSGAVQPNWSPDASSSYRGSSSVLFDYSSFITNKPHGFSIEYRLRALEPQSGKTLWARDFGFFPPIPFTDPQSDSLVLGSLAASPAAQAAASRDPAAAKALRNHSVASSDSFFEIVDARTGKTRGGVLVQAGRGPAAFDAAFVAGDLLFLEKDFSRVSAYSLVDGKRIAQFTGFPFAASLVSSLFALAQPSGKLVIYDSRGGATLDQQVFPDDIAYLQFSSDGKRLFVLTSHQSFYILDVTQLHANP